MARILVVDDDKLFLQFVRDTLNNGGHQVVEASGGMKAMEIMESEAFDLLIVDVVMPDKGGIETMIDAHALSHELPIIMVSGKVPTNTEAFRRLVQKFGAREVLSKPFDEATLLSTVDDALS
ncbi:MAG: response regulator [Spirochaetaceae bacterium]|nr:MAG: response regulator [Spirochaetaceae bacterium]